MLLGLKSKRAAVYRHLLMAVIAGTLVYMVWLLNSTWSPDMRLWKAFGGGAFILLWFTLFIGSAAKLYAPLQRLVSYRREAGIWFAVIISVHGYLILDGWVGWGWLELLGYQYVPEIEQYLRVESGFGLANLMGLTAWAFAIILAVTSFDKVVNYLGVSSWKWLHTFAYVIFYIVALHVVYFAFIHYTPSLQRALMGAPSNYPSNPLAYYYLIAILSVFIAQVAAFIKAVKAHRASDWY